MRTTTGVIVTIIIIEIPAYLFLLLGIFYLVNKEKCFTKRNILYSLLFLFLLVVTVYLQYKHAHNINKVNANLIEEYGLINEYTNTIYINYYTFMIGNSALLTLQSFLQRITR